MISAKTLMIIGCAILGVGAIFFILERWGLFFGKLRGDIQISSKNSLFYFPIASSIVLSIALTIAINLFLWIWKRFF